MLNINRLKENSYFFNSKQKKKMIDLSGGISESWNLKKMTQSEKDNFWTILFQAFKKCSISIFSDVIYKLDSKIFKLNFLV